MKKDLLWNQEDGFANKLNQILGETKLIEGNTEIGSFTKNSQIKY